MAAIFLQPSCLSFDRKKTVFKLEREFDDDMKFEKNLIKNDSVRVTTATDRQTDGQAKTIEIMFCSLVC